MKVLRLLGPMVYLKGNGALSFTHDPHLGKSMSEVCAFRKKVKQLKYAEI